MRKITPCLWFDHQAEEAARFYVSVFKRSKIGAVTRYGEGAPKPAGSVLTVSFKLEGQDFVALNGGPGFQFTPALSLSVDCKTQKEVDILWDQLSEGGTKSRCAWLQDRYGVSWQIVPTVLVKMLRGKNPERARRVMAAMLNMDKIDIATLQRAYAGR